jgi:hypothetical protein
VVDYGDGHQEYFGNLESCQIKFPNLKAADVLAVSKETFITFLLFYANYLNFLAAGLDQELFSKPHVRQTRQLPGMEFVKFELSRKTVMVVKTRKQNVPPTNLLYLEIVFSHTSLTKEQK